jgi:tetratricopeptide (TPR) repeat protein
LARSGEGRFEEALELYGQARDLMVRNLGPGHPDLAVTEGNLGTALMNLDRYPAAASIIEDQLRRIEATHGKGHPLSAQPLYNLGLCAEAMENLVEAATRYGDSLAALEADGPPAPTLSFPLIGLARVAVADGRPLDAGPVAERALLLTGGDAVLRADAQAVLAEALWLARKQRPRARELADAALEAYSEIGAAADSNREDLEQWRNNHGL